MIISIEKIKNLVSFPDGWTDEKICMKLAAVEQTIRAYTNNNFQNRGVRSECAVVSGNLSGNVSGFSVGDTVQITESRYNDGLCVVMAVDADGLDVGGELVTEDHVLATKVVYPPDVVDCAVNLIEWEAKSRGKVGIKSETLSRHSVTYEDSASMFRGYPKGILSTVSHYRKVRC